MCASCLAFEAHDLVVLQESVTVSVGVCVIVQLDNIEINSILAEYAISYRIGCQAIGLSATWCECSGPCVPRAFTSSRRQKISGSPDTLDYLFNQQTIYVACVRVLVYHMSAAYYGSPRANV